jgi:hypothetical protein
MHTLSFVVDLPGFWPFKREETNHRSLFQIKPKEIRTHLEFNGRLTRETTKRAISREIREMGTCYIYMLFTR